MAAAAGDIPDLSRLSLSAPTSAPGDRASTPIVISDDEEDVFTAQELPTLLLSNPDPSHVGPATVDYASGLAVVVPNVAGIVTIDAFSVPEQYTSILPFKSSIKALAEKTVVRGADRDGHLMQQADNIYRELMTGIVCIMNVVSSNDTVRTIGIAACELGTRSFRGRQSFDMQLLLVDANFTGKKLGGILLDQLLLSVPDKSVVNVRLPECLNNALPIYRSRGFSPPLAGNAGNNQFSTLDVDRNAIRKWPVMGTLA